MFFTCPLISQSSSPRTNNLVTLPSAPITIGFIVTFMFHNYFRTLSWSRYLSLFSLTFCFTLRLAGKAGSLFCFLSRGLDVWPRLDDPFVSQNPSEVVWSNFSFLLLLLLLIIIIIMIIRVFHISVSWWSFTGDWVTASLLKSPGLFSVFWPFSIMLLFGWSPLGHQLLNLPGPLIII